jgi:alkaline phosphatase D
MIGKLLLSVIFIHVYVIGALAQNNKLVAGPMLGYAEHKECLIWVETKCAKKITIKYQLETEAINHDEVSAYVANGEQCQPEPSKIIIANLEPGKTYKYKMFLDNVEVKLSYPLKFTTRELWEWRKDPPSFSFLTGSCAYINDSIYDRPGAPYGQGTQIFKTMGEIKSNFMLWLGDNTYLREVDYSSVSGVKYRYTHTRKQKDLQKLLATRMNYATWDDHDYGPNNASKTYELKEATRQTFIDFWGNKSFGEDKQGIYTKFHWSDCDFFLLDNRYFRDEDELPESAYVKTQMGRQQLDWFKQSLFASHATFKFVVTGGQFLNINTNQESYVMFLKERQEILDFIKVNNIKGVVFITGDRHHTEITKLERTDSSLIKPAIAQTIAKEKKPKKEKKKKEGDKSIPETEEAEDTLVAVKQPYTLYELTCSPLSSKGNTFILKTPEAKNPMRIAQTLVTEPNFCHLFVNGKPGNRNLLIKCFNNIGELKWEFTISQQDLE